MPRLTGNRCQCAGCGEYFNGAQPFDKHRTGDYAEPGQRQGTRRCQSAAEMQARGWIRNAAGFWCERAKEPTGRPRALAFAAHRAPLPRARPQPEPRAQESRPRKAGAT